MRKFIHIMTSCLLILSFLTFTSTDADARKKKKGKKDEVEAPEVKKTPYEKFMEDKDLQKEDGFINIYRLDEEIYLEIPQEMLGKRIISSSRVESSTDPSLAVGSELSSNQTLIIDRTDSLILLRRPAANVVIKDNDPAITRALAGREPILYTFPIKYRNADSTAFVVKADDLFDLSDKRIVNFRGKSYDDYVIAEGDMESDRSLFRGLATFGNSIGVRNEATFELGIAVPGFGFVSSERPVLTTSILTTVSLVPEEEFSGRISDTRVGTRHEGFTVFEAKGEIDTDTWAERWNLQPKDRQAYFSGKGSEAAEPIRIYVDTLLGEAWMKAVEAGVMAWQPAFDAFGLRKAIVVEPYPAEPGFIASSPLVSTVSFAGGSGTDVGASVLSDATSGRIMSCRITVPGDYISGVHKRAVYTISDVDPRYQQYDLPEDAVCEVLKADIMKTFGLCLGLTSNMAGSAAYSPEQLRDPEFTSRNGITASVTDDVLFNYLTRPGDKERGVATIVDQIGAYDRFAIEWLYRPFEKEEKHCLDSMILSKKGAPEYFFAGRQRGILDCRAIANDLGNDIFEAYDAGVSHVRFAAEHADRWFDPDETTSSYAPLFLDWLWLRFNSLSAMLSSHIGAINSNDVRTGKEKLVTLPESVQKKALNKSFDNYFDVTWMEVNRKLLHISGAYKDVTRLTTTSIMDISGISRRLPYVAMAEEECGNSYTAKEFMKDIENRLFAEAAKGHLHDTGYDFAIGKYLVWLISNSDVMKQNYKDVKNKTRNFALAEDAFRIVMRGVPVKYTTRLEGICYESLVSAKRILEKGMKACRNAYDRGRYEFLISIADAGLGK